MTGAVFAALWCCAILAHHDDRFGWLASDYDLFSAALAFAALWRPRSAWLLLGACLAQILNCWVDLPEAENHWVFASFVSLALAAVLAARLLRERGRPAPLPEDWALPAAGPIRLMVIFLYMMAAFHKLNSGYFDPDLSCAADFYSRVAAAPLIPSLPEPLPEGAVRGLAMGVLAAEAAIPLLLAGRRTWAAGLALGILFHLAVGLLFRHFSTVMFALYFLFLPDGVARRLADGAEEALRRRTGERLGILGLLRLQAAAFTAWSFVVWVRTDRYGAGPAEYFLLLRAWDTAALAAAAGFFGWLARTGLWREPRRGGFGTDLKPLTALSVLFLLNGLSPYAGLKTNATLSMYSNLDVTGGRSNHWLMPAALQVFPFARDVVRIEATNIRAWTERLKAGYDLMPYLQLRRAAAEAARRGERGLTLVYERQGVVRAVQDLASDPELAQPEPYLLRKLVAARDGRSDGRAVCAW